MNNEPVAYINKDDGLVCAKCYKPFTKYLTDEEVKEIATEHIHMTLSGERFGYLEFARAILKKASEK